ncbi:MAG TPA: DUF4388 domain-containing protein [Thermoanaerobaculia bacterium]
MTLSGTDRRRVRGHLQDVAPAAFVQMIAIERETCSLVVREEEKEGVLSFVEGELWDARLGSLAGEEAAIRILGWDVADVQTRFFTELPQRSINAPLTFILLESMRRRDEDANDAPEIVPEAVPEARAMSPEVTGPLRELDGVDGAFLMDLGSGRVLEEHFAGPPAIDSGEVIRACLDLARADTALAARAMPRSALEEIVLTFIDRVIILRILRGDLLIAVLADPGKISLPAIHARVRGLAPPGKEPSSWRG